MSKLDRWIVLGGLALLLATPAAAGGNGPLDEYATNEVALGRNDTAVCSGINKGDGPANLVASLKDGAGNQWVSTCPAKAVDAACTSSLKHNSAIPKKLYCWVSIDAGTPVSGNLVVNNPIGVSRANTDLQPLSNAVKAAPYDPCECGCGCAGPSACD